MDTNLDSKAILDERGPKNGVSPNRPYHYLVEQERSPEKQIENVATIFLSNRECPFRCLMCDLWKNTTDVSVTAEELMEQVHFALAQLESEVPESCDFSSWKLYNSGNFFDRKAIHEDAAGKIGELANQYYERSTLRRLIVECHPKLVGATCFQFSRDTLPRLEVAMGLETVHPEVLPKLNKQMTLEDFKRSTELLLENSIDVRAFVLLRTPWMSENEGIDWALRSVEWAFSIGVQCCAVIPTRRGNGILDRLEQIGEFEEPNLSSLELVQKQGLELATLDQRMFVDDWDAHRFSNCSDCEEERINRIQKINLSQELLPEVQCHRCS